MYLNRCSENPNLESIRQKIQHNVDPDTIPVCLLEKNTFQIRIRRPKPGRGTYSQPFRCGTMKWRLMFTQRDDQIAVFLCPCGITRATYPSSTPPEEETHYGWGTETILRKSDVIETDQGLIITIHLSVYQQQPHLANRA